MRSDQEWIDLVRSGYFRVDADGSVWRQQTRSRTGRLRSIEPIRADAIGNKGYRRVFVGSRSNRSGMSAHRLVWLVARGLIPSDVEVNHRNLDKTDNRIDNLELLTHEANVQHAFAAGVVPPMRGETNGQHKLTEAQVIAIRGLVIAGESRRVIARRFGVSHVAVNHIAHGRNWKHAAFPEVARG